MDAIIFIGVVIASIAFFIIIGFIVGQRTVKHQEKLNNDKILQQRTLIEKDIQHKTDIVNKLENEYKTKKQLIEDAERTIELAYNEKIKALDILYQQKNKELNDNHIQKSIELNNSYQQQIQKLSEEKEVIKSELISIKRTRDAAIEAARKEREIQQQPDKYCIPISKDEIYDIEYLNNIMPKLKFPEVLGKCIWSVFFQKKMKTFLSGILGQNEICGIYKITDQLTQECYIGQSKQIKKRWTDHIKYGIGALPSSNANQLYAAMRRDGVWNFSFELLEECSVEELEEKERQFIDLYSADNVGLNSKKGNQSNTLKE